MKSTGAASGALALATILLLGACGGDRPAAEAAGGSPGTMAAVPGQYTCPMHPQVLVDTPGQPCPICGMKLVPADRGAPQPEGAVLAVAPEMIQTMGVRTVTVKVAQFGRTVRAFGNVESDERLESVSVSRLEGWVEDLAVRAAGDPVQRGALLYRVYSPALIAAQKDWLAALATGRQERIDAARQRLLSGGMQAAVVDRLAREVEVIQRLPVYAEAAGTVTRLEVREGDYVKPGTPVLRLQSYARVWIIAAVPEADLALIEAGQPVSLRFPSAPGATGQGRVDYIYPTIDPGTRTGDVRIEIENPGGALRPGAYADIQFRLTPGEARLSVPTEALLRDSRGYHVIVALGDGRFAGRAVATGVSTGARTEILAGLEEGETVVVSGQFLLDSEANLREGLSRLEPQPDNGAAGHSTSGRQQPAP